MDTAPETNKENRSKTKCFRWPKVSSSSVLLVSCHSFRHLFFIHSFIYVFIYWHPPPLHKYKLAPTPQQWPRPCSRGNIITNVTADDLVGWFATLLWHSTVCSGAFAPPTSNFHCCFIPVEYINESDGWDKHMHMFPPLEWSVKLLQ